MFCIDLAELKTKISPRLNEMSYFILYTLDIVNKDEMLGTNYDVHFMLCFLCIVKYIKYILI